jgi:hypothetical protein
MNGDAAMKLILSTLLAALALPTMADIGSSASLTGLRYELVDLDLNDGVDPYVKFTGTSQAWAMLGPRCAGICDNQTGGFTTPVSASRTWSSEVNGTFAAVSEAGLFASGYWNPGAGLTGNRPEYHSWARHQGIPGQPLFVVSAHTGLRITGQYMLDAWVDPFRDPQPLLRGRESSGAGVFFHSDFIDGPAPSRGIQVQSDWLSAPDHAHESGEISVLLHNDKAHQATLWGKWGVQADGFVPGVPEPSTYALMLAGLAMVAATVRRRQP